VVFGALLIAGLMPFAAQATVVHRCVGADGTPRYQDAPCAAGDAADRMELKTPAAMAPIVDAAPPARTPSSLPVDRPRPPPPPPLLSWRCEVENGETYFRHDGCPESIVEPVAYATGYGGFGGHVYLRVWGYRVLRVDACREIGRGARFGAERDQRAQPYEKLSGRDLCR
jgi:hypothetical protein